MKERKLLRKIVDSSNQNGKLILNNQELQTLYKYIIRNIKIRRLEWLGH